MPRYIDADALIRHFYETEYASMYYVEVVKRIIDAQPTISPDEVRGAGEWIKAHDDVCWWWECSECHEQPLQRYKYDRLSNYCPSCGARLGNGGTDDS